ncbi:hypothetical protein [Sebaldella termitidis]|uniref:hypothetical protein n=1 Tax=Sebaldella termitidis TaxID=826 RepID=UPI003EB6BFE7
MFKISIIKVLKEGEKQKKLKQKTFRIKEDFSKMLDNLCETTNLSQNEILNIILDDYYDEYNFINELQESLEELKANPNKIILISQVFLFCSDYSQLRLYEIAYNQKEKKYFNVLYQEYIGTTGEYNFLEKEKIVFSVDFQIKDYKELLEYNGVTSKYSIDVFYKSDVLKYGSFGFKVKEK